MLQLHLLERTCLTNCDVLRFTGCSFPPRPCRFSQTIGRECLGGVSRLTLTGSIFFIVGYEAAKTGIWRRSRRYVCCYYDDLQRVRWSRPHRMENSSWHSAQPHLLPYQRPECRAIAPRVCFRVSGDRQTRLLLQRLCHCQGRIFRRHIDLCRQGRHTTSSTALLCSCKVSTLVSLIV